MSAESPIHQPQINSQLPEQQGIPVNGYGSNGHHEIQDLMQSASDKVMKEGFLPIEHDPAKYGAAVETFVNGLGGDTDATFVNANVKPEHRLSYNGKLSEATAELGRFINEAGVYNTLGSPEGRRYNAHIQDVPEIQANAIEALRRHNVIVIAPFAQEPETIEGVVNYAASRVGKENVLAVDAGLDQKSGELARQTGTETINQWDWLHAIDFDKLKAAEIIPDYITELKGTKGLTMYAGLLKLEVEGKLTKDHYIAFHDTDIENAGPAEGRGTAEDYAALDYLGVPFAYPINPDVPIEAVHIGRTGAGRNNESWFGENQHNLNSKDPIKRKIATHISSLMWALTGERVIRGDILAQIPWPADMNIETMLNFALAGREVRAGERRLMQVANPSQKRENRHVPDEREWGMLYACEQGLRSYYDFFDGSGRFPHEWDTRDVGIYNLEYANTSTLTFTKNNHEHQPNRIAKINRGIVLPSIAMLRQTQAFDLSKVK